MCNHTIILPVTFCEDGTVIIKEKVYKDVTPAKKDETKQDEVSTEVAQPTRPG